VYFQAADDCVTDLVRSSPAGRGDRPRRQRCRDRRPGRRSGADLADGFARPVYEVAVGTSGRAGLWHRLAGEGPVLGLV